MRETVEVYDGEVLEFYENFENHACYQYAINSVDDPNVPKYVRKQCQHFLDEIKHSEKYVFDYFEAWRISELTKLVNFASGHRAGTPTYDGLAGFQWFMIMNTLCWKHKTDLEKRRYEKSVLLIGRKSGKSFLVGLIFILLLLLEPQFSEFYSVAPDSTLSGIVKKEAGQLISSSPALASRFKVTGFAITCKLTKSSFIPLAYSLHRLDGRKANVFVADEVGALPNRYPIDAMKSSQMNMKNRLGILISTAYNTEMNVMTDEIDYCERVLDGIIDDDTCFSLLYRPENEKEWYTDLALRQANPLAIEIEENFEYLVKQRQEAIDMPAKLGNFKTKHLNIFINGDDSEVFVPLDDLKKCKLKEYDWYGRDVYVGIDLSQTTDNTAVSMVTYDSELGKYVGKSWGFLPFDGVENKIKVEKIDYHLYKELGYCYYCGDKVIDYKFVEDFVMNLESKYGVNIKAIGYDRYNCISTANKLINAGYECIEVKQISGVLHLGTKELKEAILTQTFGYEHNTLLEHNFKNARECTDSNFKTWLNKKKSTGKIDMLAAMINAMVLWKQEQLEGSVYDSDEREDGFLVI